MSTSQITGMKRATVMSSSNSASRKTDLNSQSWYAAEDLPEVYVPTDIKALRKERSECNVTKPQMFASG